MDFFEILDLSTPNTREQYLLKAKCLKKFSLQAKAVDGCVPECKPQWNRGAIYLQFRVN